MPFTIEDSAGTEISPLANSVSFTNYVNRRGRLTFDTLVADEGQTLTYVSGAAWTFVSGDTVLGADSAASIAVGKDIYLRDGSGLATYTEQFDNAAWIKTRCSVTANAAVDPDGYTTADEMIEDGTASSSHTLTHTLVTATTSSTQYTWSLYGKANTRNWIYLQINDSAGAQQVNVWFNLSTGAIGTQQIVAGTPTIDDAGMSDAGSSWYRCHVTLTFPSGTAANIYPKVFLATADATAGYSGDGSSSVYLWGAQLEKGPLGNYVVSTDDTAVLWGGTIHSVSETDLTGGATTTRRFKYNCVDFDEIASRKLVAASYSSTNAAAIASDLNATWLTGEGITDGTIEGATFNITKATWNYAPVSTALDELAEITGYFWRIDKNKALQFCSRTTQLSPWNISASNKPYRKLRIETTRQNYRNTQYVRGGFDSTDAQTEDFEGDGTERRFVVSYPVESITSIKVDGGAAETVAVLGGGTSAQWYYQVGSNVITHDSGETVLTSANALQIIYVGRYPIIVKGEDDAEIAARNAVESGTGTYEQIVNAPNIDDDDLALDKAKGLLERFGAIEQIITFETDEPGLDAGQLININLSDHGINGDFLIESVTGTDRGDYELRYSVRCLSGQAFGGWVDFFKKLQSSGDAGFTIRANELLVILRTPKDTMTMADTAGTSTKAGSGTTVGSATAYVGLIDCG